LNTMSQRFVSSARISIFTLSTLQKRSDDNADSDSMLSGIPSDYFTSQAVSQRDCIRLKYSPSSILRG
jgi:hypothetical protein